ncbi:hypothetical protein HJG54_08120 [Leptolyngbya sp. NK1-12]|uniref:Uncharacterized protein n=1 Tax=Leptolyngbya sp. NK1-12 TaxID=2547451 RepID=A0AA96WD91_9CYAN|nr:hypothetical protein [Leptolyngbya sp. NK1-12]WNZ22825.1 hypothetical protein HJG54_08120 [Leptolyngbya sp. NK1-12]
MSKPSPQPPAQPDPNLPVLKTTSGRFTQQVLMHIWEPLDVLGRALMGDLWRTVYLSVQDAIALSTLLQLPGLVGRIILGKDFASLDVCWQENALGVLRYACFIIVISDFLLWTVLAGRIIGRFWADLRELWRGNRNGSNQP